MVKNVQTSPFIKELKAKARKSHTPLYGTFELTSRCNFNCKMCYVHDKAAVNAKMKELTTEQWKSIFDQAIAEGMLFALFTGGECLLREDFDELYLYLYNKGIIMSVNTNGAFIDEYRAAFFEKYQPERIQISLYGSSNENYESVTERRAFEKVMKALENLEKCHLRPEIAITASKYMTDFEQIMTFLTEKKYSYTVVTGLISKRDGQTNTDAALSSDEIVKMKAIERRVLGLQLKEHETPAPIPGCSLTAAHKGMPCNAGTIRAVITYDGKMVPCMAIPEVSIDVLENGYQKSWDYIWKKMEQVVQPPICEACYYRKKCTFCPALRYDGLFSGKCKSEYCELMVKEYDGGVI